MVLYGKAIAELRSVVSRMESHSFHPTQVSAICLTPNRKAGIVGLLTPGRKTAKRHYQVIILL